MAQRTLFVKFYHPSDIMEITPYTTDDEIKKSCFRVLKYNTPGEALIAYANTQVTWSTLLDDNEDYLKFVDEAYEHIKNNDYDWLEENFV